MLPSSSSSSSRFHPFSLLLILSSTTIGLVSGLNSVLDIRGTYPYLIDNATGQMIEPRNYMDFENIYAPNTSYRRSQTAQGRNYHLIKAFDFANYFQSDYWHYSDEMDLKLSGYPVSNEELCGQHLDWIESRINVSDNLFARGEQHLNLMLLMDSFGRPQASTYQGRAHWLGSHYECKRVQLVDSTIPPQELASRRENIATSSLLNQSANNYAKHQMIKTRYCIGKARDVDWPTKQQDSYTPPISYKVGLCLPEACDTLSFLRYQSQIERLMRFNMPEYMKNRIQLRDMYCLPDERSPVRSLKLPARIYLTLCALWLFMLLLSSKLYYFYMCHHDPLMSADTSPVLDSAADNNCTKSLSPSQLIKFKGSQSPDSSDDHLTALMLQREDAVLMSDSGQQQQQALTNGIGRVVMAADEKFMLPPPHPLLVSTKEAIELRKAEVCSDRQSSTSSSHRSTISLWLRHKHPVLAEALRALSIIENVIDFQKPPAAICSNFGSHSKLVRVNLNALDAIKCLCCVLVIFGHIIFIHMQHISNVIHTIEQSSSAWPKLLIAFFNFVDTFFVISGMLTTYFLFKRFNKDTLGRPLVWLMIILMRFLRLTPVYLLVLWFTKTVAVHLSHGPLWDYGTDKNSIHGLCINDHWWKSILYLGNLGTMQPLCVLPAWSIIVDAQYSLILPPLIFLLMKQKKLGYLSLMVAVVVSTTNMSLQLAAQTAVKSSDMAQVRLHVYPLISRFAAEFYNTPWNRVGPVAVGVIGGYKLYLYEIGVISRWPWFMRGWALKVVLFMHAFVFILPTFSQQQQQQQVSEQPTSGEPANYDLTVFLLSNAAIKPIWSIVNTILLLRLITDLRNNSFVARLMSNNIWHCLGKICFASYLIHYEVIILLLKSNEAGLVEPSWTNVMREFSLTFLISTTLAYFVHVLFEAPINKLVTLAFGGAEKFKKAPNRGMPSSRTSNSFQLNDYDGKPDDICESPISVKKFADKSGECQS